MTHRKFVTPLVIVAALATAGTAGAVTSNTFGFGGSQPVLTPSCAHGAYDFTGLPTRKAMAAGFAVSQGTLQCEHRRVSRLIGCAKTHPVTEAPADKQGFHDETGMAAFVACIAGVTGVK
jgi:hypothetical protein